MLNNANAKLSNANATFYILLNVSKMLFMYNTWSRVSKSSSTIIRKTTKRPALKSRIFKFKFKLNIYLPLIQNFENLSF